ncbi:spore cortex biosynthesis protein YabQ [Paenibacillus sp. CECT 9249]|uniref:spore cortex biosynthesis protein YabQ n=1 Tax=unclassified Paenibacillus TaxID=185978 RepID=UPI001C124227|nr:spore cortex biosynthesis protein YabQ [Paenibacillus sp. CECT 9249]MBU5444125.1 spore cortex biosynthesis protein YabQ [Paenibacillus sp. MSJ-34]CAH0122001.1 hypothetical protein PAE9249_04538 [Paenibacillus sp. CECT 9249]
MSLHIQLMTVLAMLASGVCMGIVFDSYRVVSGQLYFPKWTKPVLDIVYWLLATGFVFRVLYVNNQGEVRFYVFLGLFLGVWFYFLFISSITVKIVVILIKAVKQFIWFLVRFFDVTVVRPIILLYRLLRILAGFLLAISIFIGKMLLHILLPFWKLLAWMAKPLVRRLRMPEWLRRIGDWIAKLWKRLFD